jgi:hypothetical protein
VDNYEQQVKTASRILGQDIYGVVHLLTACVCHERKMDDDARALAAELRDHAERLLTAFDAGPRADARP